MSKKQKIIFIIIFLVCFFIQIIPVIRSGIQYNSGIGFWGSNGHDAIWHLSLINHIKNPLKIAIPIYAGSYLKNYHPFFDILIAFFHNISHLSSTVWYFQIFPIISTFLYLITSYILGKRLTQKFYGGILLMFFNSFANSFGWIVSLIKSGNIAGESLFWAMQSVSNQLNPPFLLSLIFINILLIYITSNDKNKYKFINSLGIILILAITPITKAYGGVAMYLIFGFYSLYILKKDKKPLLILLISLPISYLFFSIYNSTSTSLFVFKPFWFINALIEAPDRFYIPKIVSIRYALENSGLIGPKLILIYGFSIGAFYLGNFSWRLLGIFSLKKFNNSIKLPLLLTTIITALIPMFFIQKGTSWNTIQFLYYSLFISNIFLTIFLIQKSSKIISLIVILLTLIPSFETLNTYLSNPSPAVLPINEIVALNKLKELPSGIVLTYPYDPYKKKYISAPLPLYIYETTAYVSAFSEKTVFLEDEMNLDITGFNWKNRRLDVEKFFNTNDEFFARGFLVNNQIDYIYLVNGQKLSLSESKLQINQIYNNGQVQIYQVQR